MTKLWFNVFPWGFATYSLKVCVRFGLNVYLLCPFIFTIVNSKKRPTITPSVPYNLSLSYCYSSHSSFTYNLTRVDPRSKN